MTLAVFLRVDQLDQLPPGLYADEAVNALDALRLINDGNFAIFYPGNNGREPLHIYFEALALLLWGNRPWSLRLASALIGILSIPLFYRFAGDLFQEKGKTLAHAAGVTAMAGMAFLYWHLSLSRVVLRAIFLLPLMIAAYLLFWRGWRQNRPWLFVGSGIALGLSQYTYLPARLLPLPLILFAAIQSLVEWRKKKLPFKSLLQRPQIYGLLIVGGVSFLLFAPLAIYFTNHPNFFLQRVSSATIGQENEPAAAAMTTIFDGNARKVLAMFSFQGDLNGRHNLPGRPVFDFVSSILFFIGLLVALTGIKKPRHQFILLWLAVMLTPTLLSTEAPHFLRAVGALPPILLLLTSGMIFLIDRLKIWVGERWSLSAAILIGAYCLLTFIISYNDYFHRWPQVADLNESFSLGEVELAQRALTLIEEKDVAVPLRLLAHPTFQYFVFPEFDKVALVDNRQVEKPAALIGVQSEFMDPAVVILSGNDGETGQIYVPQLLDEAAAANLIDTGAYEIDSFNQVLHPFNQPFQAAEKNFGNQIALTGYHLTPHYLQPGKSTAKLVLEWQSLARLSDDYLLFVHLISVDGGKIAQEDRYPLAGAFPTSTWQAGERFFDAYYFPIPADVPPGKYRFDIGWLNIATGQRLPLFENGAPLELDHAVIGALTVPDLSLADQPPEKAAAVSFGEPKLIELSGFTLDKTRLAEEGIFALQLHWHTPDGVPLDYTAFVHVLNEAGELVAQSDKVPGQGRFPTSLWFPGETVIDTHQIQLPPPPGQTENYVIAVGFYYWPTGERLPVFDDQPEGPSDFYTITTLSNE